MSTTGESAPRPFAAYAVAGLVWAWFAWRFDFICDDAFISFRYSHHLAEGSGLVYNTAREVPVEGYSNFLWVVWLSLFERLGCDITAAARWSSLLAGGLLLCLTMKTAERRLSLDVGGLTATGLFLASLPAFGLWSTGGLATMPSALAIFGVLYALHGNEEGPRLVPAVLCAAAATLLRADGIGYLGLILAATFAISTEDAALRQRMRSAAVITAASIATVFIAHAVWRHGYYGEWVPNTAKIKAGLTTARLHRGLLYVGAFIITLPAIAVGALIGLRRWREGPLPLLMACALLVGGSFGYSIYVGGDFMPFGRFLVPALPAVALLFAWGWSRLAPKPAWALASLCVIASAAEAYNYGPAPRELRAMYDFRFRGESFQTEVERWDDMKKNAAAWNLWGRAIAEHVSPEESIILGGLGAIGYHAPDLTIYDTYGLVTPIVLGHAEPKKSAAPGHDVEVSRFLFIRPAIRESLPQAPAYFGAMVDLGRPLEAGESLPEWIISADDLKDIERFISADDLKDLNDGLRENDYDATLSEEVYELDPAQGFPKDSILRLLRINYD